MSQQVKPKRKKSLSLEDRLDEALAAQLQAALLPEGCPSDCPHQTAAARNRMCGSVGGDFYDFIRLNEDQTAVLIGDVVGHGVRAALLMAQITGYLRSRNDSLARPAEIVSELNEMLLDLGDRTNMVTSCSLLYGVIDGPTGLGMFVNAGHPRPYVCDRRSCSALSVQRHNIILGVEKFEPIEICLTFHPGQRLVLHTDGLTDAADERGEHFGEARLHEVLSRHADETPEQCCEAVFEAVESFRGREDQNDDETIVVLDRH